jgi:hypothetical protein
MKKGKVEWEVSKRTRWDGFVSFEHYALREDGVLLFRYRTTGLDGAPLNFIGWTVKSYRPEDDVLFRLRANGFR